MGLFGRESKQMTELEQFNFAMKNFYQYYDRFDGRSVAARDDIWLAELHATYAELNYLRNIEQTVLALKEEVARLKNEINQSRRDTITSSDSQHTRY